MEYLKYRDLVYDKIVDSLTKESRTCFVKSKESRIYLLNKLLLDFLSHSKEEVLLIINEENFNVVKSFTESVIKDASMLSRLNYLNYKYLDVKKYSNIGLVILNDFTAINLCACDTKLDYLISSNENCLVLGTNITSLNTNLTTDTNHEKQLFTNRFEDCDYISFEFLCKLGEVVEKIKENGGVIKPQDSLGNINPDYSFIKNNYDIILDLSVFSSKSENTSFEYSLASYLVNTLPLFNRLPVSENFLVKLSVLREAVELNDGYIAPDITIGNLITRNPLYAFMSNNSDYIIRLAKEGNEDAKHVYYKARYFNKIKTGDNFLENLMALNMCLANNTLYSSEKIFNFYKKNKLNIIRLASVSLVRPCEYLTHEEKVARVLMKYDEFKSLPGYDVYNSKIELQKKKSL